MLDERKKQLTGAQHRVPIQKSNIPPHSPAMNTNATLRNKTLLTLAAALLLAAPSAHAADLVVVNANSPLTLAAGAYEYGHVWLGNEAPQTVTTGSGAPGPLSPTSSIAKTSAKPTSGVAIKPQCRNRVRRSVASASLSRRMVIITISLRSFRRRPQRAAASSSAASKPPNEMPKRSYGKTEDGRRKTEDCGWKPQLLRSGASRNEERHMSGPCT
jgi:hypothetical protein